MIRTKKIAIDDEFFGKESVGKIFKKIAPPVMMSQLIQALYNVVDSFFVGKYSNDGQTALSVIFPLQLVITALAVGTGVGVNTHISRLEALGDKDGAKKTAGAGIVLAVLSWALFAAIAAPLMRIFVSASAEAPNAVEYGVTYGTIITIFGLGTFLESMFSKILQAHGNMRLPMIAQIAGALTNIILDPFMIFGIGFFPEMGIAGAAWATVLGQFVSAAIVGIKAFYKPPKFSEFKKILKPVYIYGYPSILKQALYTVYIMTLNIILHGFSDAAVTTLGLYYKLQTFFFIPLTGLETCIVPLISFNFARKQYDRCKKTMQLSMFISATFMLLGIICFEFLPRQMIGLFSSDQTVQDIGSVAFRFIGLSFLPAVVSLMMPVFFQAIGAPLTSVMLALTRQLFCLVPVFYLLSRIGLNYSWLAFLIAETVTGSIGIAMYLRKLRRWKNETNLANASI